jgi:hypothetical protein
MNPNIRPSKILVLIAKTMTHVNLFSNCSANFMALDIAKWNILFNRMGNILISFIPDFCLDYKKEDGPCFPSLIFVVLCFFSST